MTKRLTALVALTVLAAGCGAAGGSQAAASPTPSHSAAPPADPVKAYCQARLMAWEAHNSATEAKTKGPVPQNLLDKAHQTDQAWVAAAPSELKDPVTLYAAWSEEVLVKQPTIQEDTDAANAGETIGTWEQTHGCSRTFG